VFSGQPVALVGFGRALNRFQAAGAALAVADTFARVDLIPVQFMHYKTLAGNVLGL